MKNTKKIWALVVLVFASLLVISSCKKKQCYRCYAFLGSFRAFKNGDTIVIGYMQSTYLYRDSINHYVSLGYVVQSGVYDFGSDPASGAISCDTNFDYPAVLIHDSCAPIM